MLACLGAVCIPIALALGSLGRQLSGDYGSIVFLVAILLVPAGAATFRLGKRMIRRPLGTFPERDIALYLRSFRDDRDGKRSPWAFPLGISTRLATEEEQLSYAFSAFGYFLTISDPRRSIPHLGARRAKLAADWMPLVEDFAQSANIVIIRVGDTEGLLREVDYCSSWLPLEKIILVMSEDMASYAAMRKRIKGRRGVVLPEYYPQAGLAKSVRGLVYFDAREQAHLVHVRSSWFSWYRVRSSTAAIERALDGKFQLAGIAGPERPAARRRGLALAVDAMILVVFSWAMSHADVSETAATWGIAFFWLAYSVGFELSPIRATPGKPLFGLRILSHVGLRCPVWFLLTRHASRLFSLPSGLCFIPCILLGVECQDPVPRVGGTRPVLGLSEVDGCVGPRWKLACGCTLQSMRQRLGRAK